MDTLNYSKLPCLTSLLRSNSCFSSSSSSDGSFKTKKQECMQCSAKGLSQLKLIKNKYWVWQFENRRHPNVKALFQSYDTLFT